MRFVIQKIICPINFLSYFFYFHRKDKRCARRNLVTDEFLKGHRPYLEAMVEWMDKRAVVPRLPESPNFTDVCLDVTEFSLDDILQTFRDCVNYVPSYPLICSAPPQILKEITPADADFLDPPSPEIPRRYLPVYAPPEESFPDVSLYFPNMNDLMEEFRGAPCDLSVWEELPIFQKPEPAQQLNSSYPDLNDFEKELLDFYRPSEVTENVWWCPHQGPELV